MTTTKELLVIGRILGLDELPRAMGVEVVGQVVRL